MSCLSTKGFVNVITRGILATFSEDGAVDELERMAEYFAEFEIAADFAQQEYEEGELDNPFFRNTDGDVYSDLSEGFWEKRAKLLKRIKDKKEKATVEAQSSSML